MTARARFSQADIERAMRAAEKCGLSLARVRICPDGSIELVAGEPESADKASNWFNDSPLYRDAAA
jgi:hypothetical protein